MFQLFFSPIGTIGRRNFWTGVVGLSVLVFAINRLLGALNPGGLSFTIGLIFPFLILYLIVCIYGKRLHDMGHSRWPLIGAIALQLIMIIVVMLAFGGAEYFEAFSQYERKAVIDPDVREEIISTYQAEISANITLIRYILWSVPVLFTLWVGTSSAHMGTEPQD